MKWVFKPGRHAIVFRRPFCAVNSSARSLGGLTRHLEWWAAAQSENVVRRGGAAT